MKALKCLNCKTVVVVCDNSAGFCGKCHMPLQSDKLLDTKLKLTKDIIEPIKKEVKKKKKKVKSKTNKKKIKKKVKKKK